VTPPDPDDATVTYSVRDLLDVIKTEQTAGFTRLETSMNGKADAADVARIAERVDHHGTRLDKIDTHLRGREERRYTIKAILATISGVCIALGGLGGFLAAIHVIG
jgi:hypothetical protein